MLAEVEARGEGVDTVDVLDAAHGLYEVLRAAGVEAEHRHPGRAVEQWHRIEGLLDGRAARARTESPQFAAPPHRVA